MGKMLFFRVFKDINRSQGCKCKNLRFLTTQTAVVEAVKTNERKYVKEQTIRKLQPWKSSHLQNIFAGTIDKKIFVYPTIVSEESFDTVLQQSAPVESFFNANENIKLTKEIVQKLRELELFGLSVPQKYGGAGYNESEIKLLHECTASKPELARFIGYSEDFGCRLINIFGTEEQKQKYLPDLTSGRRFVALAYLENGPLVDLHKIEGSVVTDKVKKEYILSAEKKWVHYANQADLFLVLLKNSTIIEDSSLQLRFNMFIVEKNTPGVEVYKLKSEWAENANLFEMSLKNVTLPFSSVLGGPDLNGYDIIKHGLAHSHLTDATLCLSLMKRMLHEVICVVEESKLFDKISRGHLVIENVSALVSHIYALESVIYLITGSHDMYDKPDIFLDSVMAKILAVDFVRLSIQFYTEILGNESYKKSRIIEEAIEVLQYHSVLDENIENLKLMVAAEGLISATSKLVKKIKILKNPFDNPYDVVKLQVLRNLKLKEYKSRLNLKMELHSSLSNAAEVIESNLVFLQVVIEELFIEQGNLALQSDHVVSIVAEIASYLFAAMACVSRASSSICYDVKNFNNETIIAQIFTQFTDIKIQKLFLEELKYSEVVDYYRLIGKNAFHMKEYPLEHPLSRAF